MKKRKKKYTVNVSLVDHNDREVVSTEHTNTPHEHDTKTTSKKKRHNKKRRKEKATDVKIKGKKRPMSKKMEKATDVKKKEKKRTMSNIERKEKRKTRTTLAKSRSHHRDDESNSKRVVAAVVSHLKEAVGVVLELPECAALGTVGEKKRKKKVRYCNTYF